MIDQGNSDDRVFAALAHAGRRHMLDLLSATPGISVTALATHFAFSRVAVMKHLATLEAADLVISEKKGRIRRLWFNPLPIQDIYDRWTNEYSAFWAGHMADIKVRVESRARERKHA